LRNNSAKTSTQRNRRPTGGAGAFVGVCDGDAGATCRGIGRGRRFFTFTASCFVKYSATQKNTIIITTRTASAQYLRDISIIADLLCPTPV